MVQIEREAIVVFHEGIIHTIGKILKLGQTLSDHGTSAALLKILIPPCERFMESFGPPFGEPLCQHDISVHCRILTLLDIGMGSHVGPHGSWLDIEYMAQESQEFLVATDPKMRLELLSLIDWIRML
jgi:hypothetical protein